jgi:hypothetical protein
MLADDPPKLDGFAGAGRIERREWRDATSDHCFLAFQQATTSLASSTAARRQVAAVIDLGKAQPGLPRNRIDRFR